MCSVFGLIDYNNSLNAKRKNRILSVLSKECEVRGTDATGIAYNYGGKLCIYKRPLPAHKMKFRIPNGVNVILGHTRMTTQGSEKRNINNHPFAGKVSDGPFALAHNGMLWNDEELRKSEKLPPTPIETDSYIAVQLIEQQKALHFDSLKTMAEKVQGSFVFTALDHEDSIWFVKGDNPLHLFCYDGYLLYASTEDILIRTERKLKIRHHGTIDIGEGEILKIDRHGKQSRGTFIMQHTFEHFWRAYPYYGRRSAFESYLMDEPETLENLFAMGKLFGVQREEVQLLLDYGCGSDEIEELFYDPALLHEMIGELCYAY